MNRFVQSKGKPISHYIIFGYCTSTLYHDFFLNTFFNKILVTDQEKHIIDAQKKVEMKLTAVFIEHNIPFRAMDHLVDCMKSCVIDSKVSN